ncbi:MAG: hypothetical protein ABW252_11165 [Polyangiales bacterium]
MPSLHRARRSLLVIALLGAAACGAEPAHDEAPAASAQQAAATTVTDRAFDVLAAGRAPQLGQVLSELDAEAKARESGYAYFYGGAFRIWAIVNSSSLTDMLALPTHIQEGLARLERGHELLPNDFRATSFLAMGQLIIGNTLGDAALVDAGLRTFEVGLAQMPAYGHYLRAVAQSGTARDSALFKRSIEDMRAVMRECDYPTGAVPYSYVYPVDGEDARRPHVCLNDGIVPHVWEGVFATYGDIMLKAGDVAAGRALYESAKSAPNYASWPYRAALEERLQTADKRSAQYTDRNALNDPVMWTAGPMTCVGCHQTGGTPVR